MTDLVDKEREKRIKEIINKIMIERADVFKKLAESDIESKEEEEINPSSSSSDQNNQ